MYGEVRKLNDFKTAFVFAKLEGPLITLGFAKISRTTGEFGYNSEVKNPTIETVRNYLFIETKDIDSDLLGAIEDLIRVNKLGAFTICDGSICFAAEMKVSAFEILIMDAVILLSWNISVSRDICGVAVINISKGTKLYFAYVELGILAIIDCEAGVLKIATQLAPSLYILNSSCRLTRGFALYY